MLFCVLQKAVGISVTMRYAKKQGKKIVNLADEEVCLGSLLTLTLRAVTSNGELAEAVLTNGLDFGIGSHSACD